MSLHQQPTNAQPNKRYTANTHRIKYAAIYLMTYSDLRTSLFKHPSENTWVIIPFRSGIWLTPIPQPRPAHGCWQQACHSCSLGHDFHFPESDLRALAKSASLVFFTAQLGLLIIVWLQLSRGADVLRSGPGIYAYGSTWQYLIESREYILLWALWAVLGGRGDPLPQDRLCFSQ